MRLSLASLAEASTIEKVRFAEGAWNDRDAVAGERRAEGNWDVVGNNPPPFVDASHDELSARSMR
jgi:nuclear transport factor 2 (NTF2) superfamily protein